MKLEDIKLQLGDKITFDDGSYDYFNRLCENNPYPEIVKIERYVPASVNVSDVEMSLYQLNIVWERKEILDKEEKEYLSNVIRPFRDKVKWIRKTVVHEKRIDLEYIAIGYKNRVFETNFLDFKKGTMYKGMELNKEYSLEELGL